MEVILCATSAADLFFLLLLGRESSSWRNSGWIWRKPGRTHGQNAKPVAKQILTTNLGVWIDIKSWVDFFFSPAMKLIFTYLIKWNCYRGGKRTDLTLFMYCCIFSSLSYCKFLVSQHCWVQVINGNLERDKLIKVRIACYMQYQVIKTHSLGHMKDEICWLEWIE